LFEFCCSNFVSNSVHCVFHSIVIFPQCFNSLRHLSSFTIDQFNLKEIITVLLQYSFGKIS
jgi:hypothetical protein